jgi:tetratricopeptide (TPR) repeat protein
LQALDQELGVIPSEETRDLYKHLMQREKPAITSVTADVQHAPPEILPIESPAFLDAQAPPWVGEQGVFVGRERELAQLDEFLMRTLEGKGQIRFVIGEAGQGKTSLLNEFTQSAQKVQADLVIANGFCDAYAGIGDVYLPFRDILGMLTGDVENQWSAGVISREHALRLWRLLPTTLEAIIDLGPELLDTFVPAEALAKRIAAFETGEEGRLKHIMERLASTSRVGRQSWDQSHLFEAYTQVLKKLAGLHPLVLILDDLHWADVSSISMLFYLTRRARGSRIFIVGAYRPEDVAYGRDNQEHPLESVFGEFKRHFGKIWIDLDHDEQVSGREFVDALLDTEPNRIGEDFRQELAHHTGGHPLFTVELLRDMQERGDLVHDEMGLWEVAPGIGWDTLPARVEGVIQKRITRLDVNLKEVLIVASVEGEAFIAEVIARVLRVKEQTLVHRLSSELEKRHRLVRATKFERSGFHRLSHYRFRHILFQVYLYNGLDEVERAYWHEAVGNELEALYADQVDEIASIAGQLARHFYEAGDYIRALKYYTQAGDRAIQLYAYEEASQFLQKALKISEADDKFSKQRVELLEKLADVHGLHGDNPGAIPLYQESLNLRQRAGGSDKWTTIRLHRKIGETWNAINSFDEFLRIQDQAQTSLAAGLQLVETEPPHLETVRLLITVSRSAYLKELYGLTPIWDTAEHYARVALEMAGRLDASIELSAALGSLTRIYSAREQWLERLQISLRRLSLSQEAHFEDPRENLDILIQTGAALMIVGEYSKAISHLLEAESLADELRDVYGKAEALVHLGQCWLRLDRWDEVLIAEEKIKILQQRYPLEHLGGICWLLSSSAAAHALRGENERAMQLRQESYEIMSYIIGAEPGSEKHWIRDQHF